MTKQALALLALAGCTQLVKFEQVPESRDQCADHVDNDDDGMIDCADPDCARLPVCEGVSLCRWDAVTSTLAVPSPSALVAARVNDDTRIDIIAASKGGELRELRNDGMRLTAQAPVAVSGTLVALAAASLDAGATTDVVVIDSAMPAAVRLLNTAGTLGSPVRTMLPAGSSAIVLGDLDGDGDVDGFTTGSGMPALLSNDGRGGFTASTPTLPAPPTAAGIGDLNRDQRLDLVLAQSGGMLRVLTQGGTGMFPFTVGQPFAGGSAPGIVLVRDVDGTGAADLVTADSGSNDVGVYVEKTGSYMALARPRLGAAARAMVAGDIDGDGHTDLVVAVPTAVLVLHGDGVGGFDELAPLISISEVRALALADLDGDGADDIIAGETDAGRVTVALSRTSGCK